MGFVKASIQIAARDAAELVGWKHPKRLRISVPIYLLSLFFLWLMGQQQQVIDTVIWLLVSLVLASFIVFVPVFFVRLAFCNPVAIASVAKQRIRQSEKERDALKTEQLQSVTRLQSISTSIRSLPQRRDIDRGHGLIDAATIAGKLMTDAMDCGLFAGDEFVELRKVIDASLKGDFIYQRTPTLSDTIRPPAHWHAFNSAIEWQRTQQRKPHISFCKDKFIEGCEWVSDCTDEVVNRLEG